MKRYLSSFILLATLAVMLLAMCASMWLSGKLARPESVFADRRSAESDLWRVEDGALRVNLNAADEETLRLFPGIGETLSEAIVEYREENGDFDSIEDLTDIYGVGEGKLDAIRDLIYCD